MNDEVRIWNFLRSKGLSAFAAAGVMGNLYAESGLIPTNLQNTYEAKLGMNDYQYTQAVDNGSYSNFVQDAAGYGLAQWTYWSRKDGLLKLAQSMGRSVGDLSVQLDFLWSELQEFGLVGKLNSCKTVRDASNVMLIDFEKPLDQGTGVQNARASWSQGYYEKYAGTTAPSVPSVMPVSTPVSADCREKYCVIAHAVFKDRDTARQQLAVLKGYGFDGIVVTGEM